MTSLTLTEIQNAVLRLMDEHGGNALFMSGNATDEMRTIIGQVAEDAIRKIHLQAPVAMLDAVTSPISSTMFERNGRWACRVLLPDDFFRLVRCSLDSWSHPVSQLWWEDSAEYAKQGNKYLMGTHEKPIAFLIHQGALQYAELYSGIDLQDKLREFIYAKRPEWSANNKIMVSDRLEDACMMQVAADTLAVLGENERAQQMQQMAERVLATYGGNERHNADNGNRIER
jgi:hypothetical protein